MLYREMYQTLDIYEEYVMPEWELVLQIENRGENNVIVANGDYSGTFSSSSSESEETSTEAKELANSAAYRTRQCSSCEAKKTRGYTRKVTNGDITQPAPLQCQRAAQVGLLSPFIFLAIFYVSFSAGCPYCVNKCINCSFVYSRWLFMDARSASVHVIFCPCFFLIFLWAP